MTSGLTREKCEANGASAFMQKPFKPSELVALVKRQNGASVILEFPRSASEALCLLSTCSRLNHDCGRPRACRYCIDSNKGY
jgi:hypothetical protein